MTRTSNITVPIGITDMQLPYRETSRMTPETLVQEILPALEEICELWRRFGPKLVHTIFKQAKVRALLFPDRTKLNLSCLGNGDCFTNEQTVYVSKPKKQQGSNPLLYWLVLALIHFSQESKRVHLHLEPSKTATTTTPWGSDPRPFDIEFKTNQNDSLPGFEMTYHTGGEYDKREVLWIHLSKTGVPKDPRRYGKPVPSDGIEEYVTNPSKQPDQARLVEMYNFLFPREESKWRHAINKSPCPDDGSEEAVLTSFAQACRCEDDGVRYALSDRQDQECRRLIELSPLDAKEFLKGKIGEIGGPFRHERLYPWPNHLD